jgi:hypothetical protein
MVRSAVPLSCSMAGTHLDGQRSVQYVQVGGVRRQQGGDFGLQRFDPVRRQLPIVHGKTERFSFDPGAGIGGQASLDGGVQGIEPDAAGRRSGGNEALPGQFQFQPGRAAVAQRTQADHADKIVQPPPADHPDRDARRRGEPGQHGAQRRIELRQARMRDQRGEGAVVIEHEHQSLALPMGGGETLQNRRSNRRHQAASEAGGGGMGTEVNSARKLAAQR